MKNSISLTKGNSVSLTKQAPSATKFLIGASWDERTTEGKDFDLDLMAVALTSHGKVRNSNDFFFYGLAKAPGEPFDSADGSLHHNGDNLVGGVGGDSEDSEQMTIDTTIVPSQIEKIVIMFAIYDAETRHQNFGSVRNAKLRIADANNPNKDIVTINLSEDFGGETVVNAAEIYRHNGEWKVKSVSQGYHNGIRGALGDFGLDVTD